MNCFLYVEKEIEYLVPLFRDNLVSSKMQTYFTATAASLLERLCCCNLIRAPWLGLPGLATL